ncbi:NAD(P)/FAD-dependent oxidoreductase [Roseivirga sp. UBA838]|uniref:NAD(P)/FAD-dependent oxidoreductase n=1 Tax=Roseivirga sp. UBA838 TaxID=1947393 RepID=UPI00257E1E2F|nr:NAD(P)/FAD-dependent oxidoreductase [Roseivirga sp. UBA838]|tara:strand:+ start:36835 stop:37728 length:894 start_codon:yes stop_codon:yes gene_type:complete
MQRFEVIIIGGSYAGLSAALALGRSLRKVLVVDSGKPCNRFTPHSQNFLTHDGRKPAAISAIAKEQVQQYKTVEFLDGLALSAEKAPEGFTVETDKGSFTSKRLVLAAGIKDILPDIPGVAECWGKSVIHCPYCHGYEFHGQPTGILANGDKAFHYAQLISNLTQELTIFTNGKIDLPTEQLTAVKRNNITLVETEIERIEQENGQISAVVLKDGNTHQINALYHSPHFEQGTNIATSLGCEITEQGLIKVDQKQMTSVPGVYACGDVSNMRAVSVAVSSGTVAGAVINFDLIQESF